MPEFRVWAPKPALVRLDVNGAVHAMTRSADGWWHTTVAAPADARYGYLLDDDPTVLPDPRSARQPDGVHARSQRWEPPGQFGAARTDTGWPGRSGEGAVIYELHIGTFTTAGTFDAAIEKLDYLVDLGIDFVELMPVNSFAGTRGWGYDGVLWYSVHEPYGGPDGLVRFIDACHTRRLGVLIDAVFNHLGPSGNYLPRFGPYLSSASNPWGDGINIAGADSDEVRHYIIDCALRWMRDFHADGLRLDAVHALVDTTAVHVLEELANATRWLSGQLGRPLSLIAETDRNDPRLITRPSHGGYGIPPNGMTTSITPSIPRYPVSGKATMRISARWPLSRTRCATATSTPARIRRSGVVGTGVHWTLLRSRPPGCSPTPAPTTKSATALSATAHRNT